MDERSRLPHYDPDYCFQVVKWAAAVCIAILFLELLMMLFVTPSAKCPGWTMYAEETGQATYLWLLAAVVTGGATTGICYVVLRWREKFSKKIYDGIAYTHDHPRFPYFGFFPKAKFPPDQIEADKEKELNFEQILFVNSNSTLLKMCVAWCAFGALPLFLMVTKCTGVPKYLGY
jgi:hypothetical protein